MAADIDPGLGHDPHCQGIEPVFLDPGREKFVAFRMKMSAPALSHLAAARVAGAEKEDFRFGWIHGSTSEDRIVGVRNRWGAPHLWTVSPAYLHAARRAGPL